MFQPATRVFIRSDLKIDRSSTLGPPVCKIHLLKRKNIFFKYLQDPRLSLAFTKMSLFQISSCHLQAFTPGHRPRRPRPYPVGSSAAAHWASALGSPSHFQWGSAPLAPDPAPALSPSPGYGWVWLEIDNKHLGMIETKS